ncbi:glycosyltransferase family 4 protein [Jiella sp. MQZ9-1]|uniref:Glycosyltransferase family 4 protein n=1 Tax=Jiella flava TaxID=2816857 RepID=A0A939FXR4_9HYPH|nr:glycosyltransferase family 1 protein [Jiella flava]MBO0661334.1 glycosyltransferase family 4 protein [Jiella flava]MCD2469979.1 glycosyltransferase family 4 protein [Jiella flava]
MTVFLDLTRISSRLLRGAPTGIDRVEFAYADELVTKEKYGAVVPIITTPVGNGSIPGEVMRDHLAKIEAGWMRDRADASGDGLYMSVKQAIDAPADPTRAGATSLKRAGRLHHAKKTLQFPFRQIANAPRAMRKTLKASAAAERCYYHSSHTQLDKPDRFSWLAANKIPSAFFIHDAIPVDYPEFCSPGSAARHHERLKTVAARAELIVVNSAATAEAVTRYMEGEGWRVPRVEVVPLGVDRWFAAVPVNAALLPQAPYFVCVGTIEPRKNLIFLFNVWRAVVQRLGPAAPKLVLVGRRGWENENMIDVLERSREIGPHIVEVADLSDLGLSHLLSGARALVAPSQVEGFSLPVAEALAMETPVIASDIPVHREISEDRALLIDPIDGPAWTDAIVAMTADGSQMGAALTDKARGYRPLTWPEHVERAMTHIDSLRS